MIQRTAEKELRELATSFKAIAVVGPRQSGKSTLVRHVFPEKPYVSLENPDFRIFATQDPRGFLSTYPDGAILDEVQRTPELFSYLQEILDTANQNGLFILTGSNNFILQEHISQSLAGRVGYLQLLPLSLEEIGELDTDPDSLMFRGGYPILYQQAISPTRWYANYIRTYVERDVRLIKNIGNLSIFEKFLRLCTGRIGQLLNMSSLAVEVGVDVKTIDAWLSVLEMSFVVFRLQPYHQNYNKRIVKMPKLYFYDVGLALSLMGVEESSQVQLHPFRGALFENLIVLEFMKQRLNAGRRPNLYFWRDNTGNEIDILLDRGTELLAIEVKSGQTITADYFKGLNFWQRTSGQDGGFVVYAGDQQQLRSNGVRVVPFRQITDFFKEKMQ